MPMGISFGPLLRLVDLLCSARSGTEDHLILLGVTLQRRGLSRPRVVHELRIAAHVALQNRCGTPGTPPLGFASVSLAASSMVTRVCASYAL